MTVSDLLTDSPAALVQGAYGMSPSMQRYMKAQAVASGNDLGLMNEMNKICMEINPKHPIVKELNRMVTEKKDDKATEDYATLLFDIAGMTSGYDMEDMAGFAKRVMGLMTSELVAEESETEEAESTEADEIQTAEVEVVE